MDIFADPSFQISTIIATIFYAVIGILIMIMFVVVFDKMFNLDLHKELIEDENVAFGILLAGVAIAIAIIVAASITG